MNHRHILVLCRLFFHDSKKRCLDADLRHSIRHDDSDIYVEVKILTGSGDWLEEDNKTFRHCVQYASKFNISAIGNERMEIKFSFDSFTK